MSQVIPNPPIASSGLPGFLLPPEASGAYFTATINDNTGIQPSGNFITQLGGTASQLVEAPPTTWSSKLRRMQIADPGADVPCGHRVLTNANSGAVISSVSAANLGGFTFALLFGTHPTTETTATTNKCIGMASFTNWSFTPTGGIWTNNAAFNTGSAFGMVSNTGDANWNFFSKANGAAAAITALGIARAANQYFTFLARNVAGSNLVSIQIVQLDPATGTKTTIFNTTLALNTESAIYLDPFWCAHASGAVVHGMVFQRAFLMVPDGSFLTS